MMVGDVEMGWAWREGEGSWNYDAFLGKEIARDDLPDGSARIGFWNAKRETRNHVIGLKVMD